MQIIKQGLTIDCIDNTPPISNDIKQCIFARHETAISDQEVDKLLNKGGIEESTCCTGDFLSSIFRRPNKDGSCRMILHLRELNEYVVYQHFEIESLQDVLNIITPFAWMASVDPKMHSIVFQCIKSITNISNCFGKTFYVFKGMPNGYGPTVRHFTTMLKAPFAWLRARGHMSVVRK